MSVKLLLFDLDETIAPDEETDRTLFAEIAETVAAERGVAAERLVQAVIQAAGTLWRESQTLAYCRAIGISSWEGLWGPFGPSASRARSNAAQPRILPGDGAAVVTPGQ